MTAPTFPPRASFRAWLADFPPEHAVGISDNPEQCPLARWLQACGLDSEVHPQEGLWIVDEGDEVAAHQERLPDWAAVFGCAVDWPSNRVELCVPVPAGSALALLDAVPGGAS